jgi:hypothetical protein
VTQRGGTHTPPHLSAKPPRCAPCDRAVDQIRNRPHEIPFDKLGAAIAWADGTPTPGQKVRAKLPKELGGDEVWACPYHDHLTRVVGRTRRGKAKTTWVAGRLEEGT